MDFNRYLIKIKYFGLFDEETTYCACQDIRTAIELVDLLNNKYAERKVFEFYYKKIDPHYIDFLDDEKSILDSIDFDKLEV